MKVPWAGGSNTGRSLNVNAQRTVNWFAAIDQAGAKEEIVLMGTPGLDVFSSLVSEGAHTRVRQVHVMRDTLYAVVGDAVYSVTSAGVATLLGTISTEDGYVGMADNGTHIIIVDGTLYGHYITGGVLTDISDADYPALDSITFQDGYFIGTEINTGRIWISSSYDASSWDALDFVTAEAKPDYALRVISTMRELWIFGETTVEPYYNSGSADFPFARIAGSTLPVGCGAKASVTDVNGIFYWLSDKGKVLKNNGYTYAAVSTTALEYQIGTYTVTSDAVGFHFTMDGHVFYVLSFPTQNVTWLYDITTNTWSEWESYYNKDVSIPYARHRSACCVRFGSKEIVGDYENGKLYTLNMTTYTDNSEYIRRIRVGQHLSSGRQNCIYHRYEVEFEAGVGLIVGAQGENPLASLDWSNDGGHTWSNVYTASIGQLGNYTCRAFWTRLGMGRDRVFRVTVTDPVKLVMLGAYAHIEVLGDPNESA